VAFVRSAEGRTYRARLRSLALLLRSSRLPRRSYAAARALHRSLISTVFANLACRRYWAARAR